MTPMLAAAQRAIDWAVFHTSLSVWAAWLALFLGLELPPVFWPGCPWETLSGTAWDSESAWHPALAFFAVGLAVLDLHIAARVHVRYLITVAVGAGVALALHFLLVRVFHQHPAWL